MKLTDLENSTKWNWSLEFMKHPSFNNLSNFRMNILFILQSLIKKYRILFIL